MPTMLPLEARLEAYLAVIADEPDLSAQERQDLFALALWPEQEPDYEHLMQCHDPFCRECAGTGEMAA